MGDREAKDMARKEKKRGTPSPKKLVKSSKSLANKENQNGNTCKKTLDFSKEDSENKENEETSKGDSTTASKTEENNNFDHPVYREISLKNGLINRADLSSLKRMCKEQNLESGGKRDMLKLRLKQFHKTQLLRDAGLLPAQNHHRGYDFYLVMDFEATCEERNSPDFPHEIIEFPGVLVDGRTGQQVDSWRQYVRPTLQPNLSEFCTTLTGISQETVDKADTFPTVLENFTVWLEEKGLGSKNTFALVTDGPFDVGRFLRLACEQTQLEMPSWARHWVNVRKGFANFYRTSSTGNIRLPGLATMLERLDLDFEGIPHSGLDDAVNIARVVSRMVADGANLKVNERLDSNPEPVLQLKEGQRSRQLPHVCPVSRGQADSWYGQCRARIKE